MLRTNEEKKFAVAYRGNLKTRKSSQSSLSQPKKKTGYGFGYATLDEYLHQFQYRHGFGTELLETRPEARIGRTTVAYSGGVETVEGQGGDEADPDPLLLAIRVLISR